MAPPRAVLAIVAAGLLVLTGFVYVAFGGPTTYSDTITVCGGSVAETTFVYLGSSTGFLQSAYYSGPPPSEDCGSESVPIGGSVSVEAFVHNDDRLSGHQLTDLTVAPPFSLQSLTPSLPDEIGPGGNLTFLVEAGVPHVQGAYDAPSVTLGVF